METRGQVRVLYCTVLYCTVLYRFSPGLGRSLAAVARLLGDIWSNTVVVVTHWAYDQAAVTRRRRLRIRENKYN